MKNYATSIEINKNIRLDLFTAESFRVRKSSLVDEPFPKQYDIPFAIGHIEPWAEVSYTADYTSDSTMVQVTTSEIRIYVRKDTGTFIVESLDGKRLYPEDAQKYGMFKNHCIVFDSANFWGEETDCSRYAHWFYNPQTELYDICLKEDKLFDTFFIYAKTYRQGYALFNELVGKESMLPKKGYGYYQTQHLSSNGNQELLLKTAELIRERNIPCDTLIIDFEWGDGANGGKELPWGSRLDWSSEYQKPYSPAEMIKKLKDMHFDVMTIRHNVPSYENRFDEDWVCYEYDSDLWWQKLQEQLDIGVVGTWQDTRRTDITNSRIYKGLERRTSKRVVMLSDYDLYRDSCWTKDCVMSPRKQKIGGRRYPFFWTGDSAMVNWSDLAYQVKGITNEHGALKGVSYITNDGLRPGGVKLGVRADQFLAFNSVCRSHSTKPWESPKDASTLAENMAIDKEKTNDNIVNSVEDLLGLNSQSQLQESIIRKYLKLRYRLLPYIYATARECYDTGFPITRPLMVQYENDDNCNTNQYPYEFMLGNDILVCPVIDDVQQMKVYLPSGNDWVAYESKEIYNGGQEIIVDVSDLSQMPIFVRSGAIIVMQDECNWIKDKFCALTLNIFGDGNAEGIFYDDDGISLNYKDGKYAFARVKAIRQKDGVKIAISHTNDCYPIDLKDLSVVLNGEAISAELVRY